MHFIAACDPSAPLEEMVNVGQQENENTVSDGQLMNDACVPFQPSLSNLCQESGNTGSSGNGTCCFIGAVYASLFSQLFISFALACFWCTRLRW